MVESSQNNPLLIIIAGPNGAGKSTFYKKFIANDVFLQKIQRIAYDDIKSQNPQEDPISIGEKIHSLISENMQKQADFLYETTGSDSSPRRIMKKAIEKGYNTALIFIGIDSPELSALRVQQRVANGGHDVPKEDIFIRYEHILKNLNKLIHLADFSIVFENSNKEAFKPLYMVAQGKEEKLNDFPDWLKKAMSYDEDNNSNNLTETRKKPLKIMIDKFKNFINTKQEM